MKTPPQNKTKQKANKNQRNKQTNKIVNQKIDK